MTKKLTILLLFSSLSGLSQTRKGDWVISPQLGVLPSDVSIVSTDSFISQRYGLNIPIHYYFSNKLSFGLNILTYYNSFKNKNGFGINHLAIGISPEIQYNFSRKRLVPFIRIFPSLYLGYEHYELINYPLYISQRNQSHYIFSGTIKSLKVDIGLNYFVKERLGVFGMVTFGVDFVNPQIYRYGSLFNIGCQYIFSRRKQEEQKLSPRAF